jgi:uncharacterized protein YxjI
MNRYTSREIQNEINPFDDPFVIDQQNNGQYEQLPPSQSNTQAVPASYYGQNQFQSIPPAPTNVNVAFYNQYANSIPNIQPDVDRRKTHQDILSLFDKYSATNQQSYDIQPEILGPPSVIEYQEQPHDQQFDNYNQEYAYPDQIEEPRVQLQSIYNAEPNSNYVQVYQPHKHTISDEDYASMLQEHNNQDDKQKINYELSEDFINKIKEQERENELARRKKERQIEEDRKLAERLQREEESKSTGPVRTSPVPPTIVETKSTTTKSSHSNTPKTFIIHTESSRTHALSVSITDRELEQVMYKAIIRAPAGTTIISDRRDRPIYRITREAGHLHPTYVVENSKEEIGICTQRFKPLSIDKKFNYKRLDTSQVLKMTGNYNGDWVIRKSGKVVSTLVKKGVGFYEITIQSDVFHCLAETLIMLEHGIREQRY